MSSLPDRKMKYQGVMIQLQVLRLLLSPILLLLSLQMPALVFSETPQPPPPGCSSMCGNVTIPYPFGLSEGCSWDESFTLDCNHSFSPPRPYNGNVEVTSINVETGEMRVFTSVSSNCFNSPTTISDNDTYSWWFNFTGSPFLVKQGKNEFTGIGCSTLALLRGNDDDSYFSGCVTTCTSLVQAESADNSNGCTGIGCCQIPTPRGLNKFEVHWESTTNPAWNYSPCSYALVAEKGWYDVHIQRACCPCL